MRSNSVPKAEVPWQNMLYGWVRRFIPQPPDIAIPAGRDGTDMNLATPVLA